MSDLDDLLRDVFGRSGNALEPAIEVREADYGPPLRAGNPGRRGSEARIV